ncbi:MAG: NTP transferase domain-containing protein [Geminicoccaceae bacterium]
MAATVGPGAEPVSPETPGAAPLSIVVLAAGRGTRMCNDRPKVLHELAGKSLIAHVLDLAASLRPAHLTTVLGAGMEDVAAEVQRLAPEGRIVIQDPPHGTGHALAVAAPGLPETGAVLVLYGDTPLLTRATLERLLERRAGDAAAVTVLGMRPPEPAGYGRLRAEPDGRLHAIVEHKHCDEALLASDLCNAGVLALAADRLRRLLAELPRQPENGEYYLTDAVGLAVARGWPCSAVEGSWIEGQGVNTQAQLAMVAAFFQARRRAELMEQGVIMEAPDTVMLSADTAIGPGAVIEPFVVFRPGVTVESGAVIHAHSYLEQARVGAGAEVGPFARLRPGPRSVSGPRSAISSRSRTAGSALAPRPAT